VSPELLALTATALAAVALATHRAVHPRGVGLTPLAAYLASWVAAITAYLWNPLHFIPLQARTWEVVGLGMAACALGYAVMSAHLARLPAAPHPSGDEGDAHTLRRLWQGCALASGLLFAAFLFHLSRRYGLANLGVLLFSLRSDLGAGSVPAGFHFFYFAEPLVPLSLLCALRFRSQRSRYLLVAAGTTLALLLTSGRTNASKAILWAGAAVLLHAGYRRLSPRLLALAAAAAALVLVVFVAIGGLIGKTYENSPVYARFGAQSPLPSGLALPYLYLAAPLPTLDQVLVTGGSGETRGSTLRPLYQVAALIDARVQVPEKVQEFRPTPYPFNVSTYLGPLYEDYGSTGVVVGSLLFGGLLAGMFWYWRSRRTGTALLLCALACVMAVTSSGDAVFNNLSYLFQVVLLVAADRLVSPRVPAASVARVR
jgi:oligosaccharide repeat unit polymerase